MYRPLLVALVALASLAIPGTAHGQEGVFVDPDSPTAKEYSVPLEVARRRADPGSADVRRVAPGERDASPLFGAGIEGGKGKEASGDGDRRGEEGSGRVSGDPPPPPVVRAAALRPGAPGGSLGTTLLVLGGAAVLLLAAALAGLALRRVSGQPRRNAP